MNRWDDFKDNIGIALATLVLVIGLLGITFILVWISASRRVEIINKEFETQYTTWDFVCAGETIEEVLIGKKNRVDLIKE